MIPHVAIAKHVPVAGGHAVLLKVTNPTLGSLRLRFAASSYKGETDWEDPTRTSTLLPNLLVDTIHQTFVNAQLDVEHLSSVVPTESVNVLSAEDSIIELGGKARMVHEDVRRWEAPANIADGKSNLRLVTQNASTVWYELLVATGGSPEQNRELGPTLAVPIALQIEVGDGSWESSLIPPAEPAAGEIVDWVTFDLVLVMAS